VYIFKPTSNIAFLIFDFLDKWASAGAPAITLIAVTAALYIGIKSLRQTENIQKQERKHRLLNEIIEWAVDILECGRVPDMLYEMRVKDVSKPEELGSVIADDIRYRFNSIKARSSYIGKIVLSFGQDLQTAVKVTTEALDRQIELLKQMPDGKVNPTAVGDHRKILDQSANKVIEEAAKIKTRDIS